MTCPVLVVSLRLILLPHVHLPLLPPAVFVVRFNAAAAPPDTLADDLAFRISGPESYVGVRGPSSLEWVLERQADLLQVLRHRNSLLSQQVFSLTQQLEQS
uniref:Uncharacterized protein n=1 Tax=Scylla olivacea TaxID=85551 RepID=A0A0P4WKF9_SCYOL